MRWFLPFALLATNILAAQDADALARALEHKGTRALDRWMKRELHHHRKGVLFNNGSTSYTIHFPTYDSLVTWLRRQPGVLDAEWDRCVSKITIWPGHSTIGVRVRNDGLIRERCYVLQEGRPGTIQVAGWRPHVRKSRELLKLVDVKECSGFVAEQHRNCETVKR